MAAKLNTIVITIINQDENTTKRIVEFLDDSFGANGVKFKHKITKQKTTANSKK